MKICEEIHCFHSLSVQKFIIPENRQTEKSYLKLVML